MLSLVVRQECVTGQPAAFGVAGVVVGGVLHDDAVGGGGVVVERFESGAEG
jgi:hypothetical protein